jgi:hypothetical protein
MKGRKPLFSKPLTPLYLDGVYMKLRRDTVEKEVISGIENSGFLRRRIRKSLPMARISSTAIQQRREGSAFRRIE